MSFCIQDVALQWFQSYLLECWDGRSMYGAGDARSTIVALICGVPQGSVFRPILFIMYTVDLVSVIESHGLSPHMYADDTEVYGSCRPAAIDDFSLRISACVGDALVCLHWLRVPERVQFKIFILTYKVLHLLAPQHLGPLNRVADLPGHRSLRSTDSNCMVVPSVRLSTVANRASRWSAHKPRMIYRLT